MVTPWPRSSGALCFRGEEEREGGALLLAGVQRGKVSLWRKGEGRAGGVVLGCRRGASPLREDDNKQSVSSGLGLPRWLGELGRLRPMCVYCAEWFFHLEK